MLIRGPKKKFWTVQPVWGKAAGGAAYAGVADAVGSTPTAFYGLRAMSAAFAATQGALIDIVDQAGANALTVNCTTSGDLDVAAISAWVTAHSVTTIKIAGLRRQNSASNALLDMAQGTLANMPVLVLSGIGSKPVMRFTGASSHYLRNGQSGLSTQTPPISLGFVAKHTDPGNWGFVYGSTANDWAMGWSGNFGATDTAFVAWQGGSNYEPTPFADNVMKGLGVTINGASSKANLNGTATTLTLGTGTTLGSDDCIGFSNGFYFTGDVCEIYRYESSALTAQNLADIVTQQKTYWGF